MEIEETLKDCAATLSKLEALYPRGIPKRRNAVRCIFVTDENITKAERDFFEAAVTKGLGWAIKDVMLLSSEQFKELKKTAVPIVHLGEVGYSFTTANKISTCTLTEASKSATAKKQFWNDIKKLNS